MCIGTTSGTWPLRNTCACVDRNRLPISTNSKDDSHHKRHASETGCPSSRRSIEQLSTRILCSEGNCPHITAFVCARFFPLMPSGSTKNVALRGGDTCSEWEVSS